MRTPRVIVLVLGIAASSAVSLAQTFDAASIKEAADDGTPNGGMRLLPSGDIRVQHMRARFLISIAHQIESYQLIGAPEWTNSTYYDINARANTATTRQETFAMMRSLLAERFKLSVHREMRPLPGFALVRVSSRTLGPGLTPSIVNCEEAPRTPRCAQGEITSHTMTGNGLPVANIIRLVASQLSAPIVDETQLSGAFDVRLRWSPEGTPTDDAPVISTAVQEQLGLKLERRQVAMEVLVVDHVERPTAD